MGDISEKLDSDQAIRLIALDRAIGSNRSQHANTDEYLRSAAKFEKFLKDGSTGLTSSALA